MALSVWPILRLCVQVHASLSKSGEIEPAALQYFDQEDSDLLLYELRFLELAVRPAAATYVAKQELNAQASTLSYTCLGCSDAVLPAAGSAT